MLLVENDITIIVNIEIAGRGFEVLDKKKNVRYFKNVTSGEVAIWRQVF